MSTRCVFRFQTWIRPFSDLANKDRYFWHDCYIQCNKTIRYFPFFSFFPPRTAVGWTKITRSSFTNHILLFSLDTIYLNNTFCFRSKCSYDSQLSQKSWFTYPEKRVGTSGSWPPQEKCSVWTAALVPLRTNCGSGGGWAIWAVNWGSEEKTQTA